MLHITIPAISLYDEATTQFVEKAEETLLLEHSLVSISKWEAFYEKPFLGSEKKTYEETIEYIKLMNLAPVNDPTIYNHIQQAQLSEINTYIEAKMTATTFKTGPGGRSNNGEFITAEIVYYWMVALVIPMECQYWHFSKLLTLVKVLNQKNAPAKKMPRRDAAEQRAALNAQRKANMNTSG